MEMLQTLLGVLFVLGLSCGGWLIWGATQSRQRKHELALARERELTKREQLRIESEERVQERADRIYLDAVQRHTGELPPPAEDGNPSKST
ncbi:hypothetical protein BWI15_34430 [Kribbella sp. ALI-6-A]|uniref:hypothetical protein n=1 Tax=Kribbella sp. ALI-6-A TaxID=1933817 RepID=UPI00097C01EE|nr:hypothetical protein [Kribbella sp. ALI-6-A]ONI68139.1 hypothetical protein BWI15_34430 [Kribbella sp. ALI-6-A]